VRARTPARVISFIVVAPCSKGNTNFSPKRGQNQKKNGPAEEGRSLI
jgi:hypothetical protein